MSDKEKKKPNTSEELIDVKSLIRGADGGGFTLEDILSEYGVDAAPRSAAPVQGPAPAAKPAQTAAPVRDSAPAFPAGAPAADLPWPEARPKPKYTGNVVSFPGGGARREEEPESAEETPEPAPEQPRPAAPRPAGGTEKSKVFPGELEVTPGPAAASRQRTPSAYQESAAAPEEKRAPARERKSASRGRRGGAKESGPSPQVSRTVKREKRAASGTMTAFPGDMDGLSRQKPRPEPIQAETREAEDPDKVIDFPEQKPPRDGLFQKIKEKADDYADQMFQESEQMDMEEIRRRERLIPGTDEEDTDDIRYVRRPRREDPPQPDLPPQELARTYASGLGGLRLRTLAVILLTAFEVLMAMLPALGFVWRGPMNSYRLQVLVCAGPLVLGMLLGSDVLAQGIIRTTQMKFGMDSLTVLSCCFTLIDALTLAASQNRSGQLPYCGAALASLALTMHGEYHKRCALRLSCRTASTSAEPFRVTLDEGKWNGKDTYAKWVGTSESFGSQIQEDDGAQQIYRVVCPVLAVACVLLSLIASVGAGNAEHIWWALSASFTASSALGAGIAYGRPFHKIARRLAQGGSALAGWPGVVNSRRGSRVLLTDGDLFPTGCVTMTRVEIFGEFPLERVTAYAATLIRDSGSGLEKPFRDMLRSQGGLYRTAEGLTCYEGGGLSGVIRGERVLVGSASFMTLMDIHLPPGMNVKNAVFCAIDGELAGIFALNYALPDAVFPSLEALLHERVVPVLATRDFNIIPAMLHQRFRLASDKMDFPTVQRRRELSDPGQSHNPVLTALLCREGLLPFAETVVGARRLRRCTQLGAVLCCVSAALGIMVSAYLVSVEAFVSLSPLNLLVYMFMWLLPVWFLTDWAPRY